MKLVKLKKRLPRYFTYYLVKGINEKRKENINEINNIFNINNYCDDYIEESPIKIIKNKKGTFVSSKLNELKMNVFF